MRPTIISVLLICFLLIGCNKETENLFENEKEYTFSGKIFSIVDHKGEDFNHLKRVNYILQLIGFNSYGEEEFDIYNSQFPLGMSERYILITDNTMIYDRNGQEILATSIELGESVEFTVRIVNEGWQLEALEIKK